MGNEVSDAVLKRIRALLAMSRGNANENEASAAAQKVQELLTQFNLSLEDVEKRDSHGKVIEDDDLMTSSSNPWRRDVATACARLYFCDHYWNHVRITTPRRKCGYVRLDRHHFIGLPHNVVVAKEMFVYMVDTIERLARESRRAKGKRAAYEHAFRHGCGARLARRLWDRYEQQTEPPKGLLVKSNVPALYTKLSAEVNDYMTKNHSDLVEINNSGKHSSWEGAMDGRDAAETISLDTQIGDDEAPKLIGGAS